jgi:hypothetical protein
MSKCKNLIERFNKDSEQQLDEGYTSGYRDEEVAKVKKLTKTFIDGYEEVSYAVANMGASVGGSEFKEFTKYKKQLNDIYINLEKLIYSITGYGLGWKHKRFKESLDEAVDAKKIIQELIDTGWSGSNESQMKAVQLLKGLATSDDPASNKFMEKLDKLTSNMSVDEFTMKESVDEAEMSSKANPKLYKKVVDKLTDLYKRTHSSDIEYKLDMIKGLNPKKLSRGDIDDLEMLWDEFGRR